MPPIKKSKKSTTYRSSSVLSSTSIKSTRSSVSSSSSSGRGSTSSLSINDTSSLLLSGLSGTILESNSTNNIDDNDDLICLNGNGSIINNNNTLDFSVHHSLNIEEQSSLTNSINTYPSTSTSINEYYSIPIMKPNTSINKPCPASIKSKLNNNTYPIQPTNIKSEPYHVCCPYCYHAFNTMELYHKHKINCSKLNNNGQEQKQVLEIGKKSIVLGSGPLIGERHLSILKSNIHGRGLFTGNFIPKGEIIIEYTGEAVSRLAALRRQHYYDGNGLENYIMRIGNNLIDATVNGNCSRFINNSCDPNCETEQVTIGGRERVLIYSSRDIRAGEELTYDYKFTSDELIPCTCGVKKCKRFINANLKELKLKDKNEIDAIIQALKN